MIPLLTAAPPLSPDPESGPVRPGGFLPPHQPPRRTLGTREQRALAPSPPFGQVAAPPRATAPRPPRPPSGPARPGPAPPGWKDQAAGVRARAGAREGGEELLGLPPASPSRPARTSGSGVRSERPPHPGPELPGRRRQRPSPTAAQVSGPADERVRSTPRPASEVPPTARGRSGPRGGRGRARGRVCAGNAGPQSPPVQREMERGDPRGWRPKAILTGSTVAILDGSARTTAPEGGVVEEQMRFKPDWPATVHVMDESVWPRRRLRKTAAA